LEREALVLAALAHTRVPHSRLVARCDNPEVLGAPFLVIERIDGADLTSRPAPPCWTAFDGELGLCVADALLELRAVSLESATLANLHRAETWLADQISRWTALWRSYEQVGGWHPEGLPGLDALPGWLEVHRPEHWTPGLLHGDMHVGNVLVDRHTTAVAAFVDWELASIGDPLLDLAHLVVTWPGAGVIEAATEPDLASPSALVKRYQELSGVDLGDFDWYRVLAAFRLAAILEGTYARSLIGQVETPVGQHLHDLAQRLVRYAHVVIAQEPGSLSD